MRVGYLYRICGVFAVLASQLCVGSAANAASGYTMQDLGVLPQGTSQLIRALNNSGEIVGGVRTADSEHRAFTLSSLGFERIEGMPGTDYSAAHGINDLGEIVGSSNSGTSIEAFRWTRQGGIQRFAPLPGDNSSEAFGINSRGQVVGYSSGPRGMQAVVWTRTDRARELGTLDNGYNKARAINAHGEVVGYSGDVHASRAFLWTRGSGMQDLNALLVPPASGLVLTEAAGINNAGWILAIGRDHHHGHVESKHQDGHEAPLRVFLLVPVR